MIQKERYFILHAPRQTGKTTYLKALATHLNESGYYQCLYVNVEAGQAARGNMALGIQAVLGALVMSARYDLSDSYPESLWQDRLHEYGAVNALVVVLSDWARHTPKPIPQLGITHRNGGEFNTPPWFHILFGPRSILRAVPGPRLRL